MRLNSTGALRKASQARARFVKVVFAIALIKSERGKIPAAVNELGRHDAWQPHSVITHPVALIQDAKMVSGLDAAEVNGPGVHHGHGVGQGGRVTRVFQGLVEAAGHFTGDIFPSGFRGVMSAFYLKVFTEAKHDILALVNAVDEVLYYGVLGGKKQPPRPALPHLSHVVYVAVGCGNVMQARIGNSHRGQQMREALS